MSYELIGKIKSIGDTQAFGSGDFTKREVVIIVPDGKDGRYDQHVPLEFYKDKCSLLDHFVVGQEVAAGFDIRGREYNERHYVNLQAWKISAVSSAADPVAPPPATDATPADFDDDDEIPF